MSTGKHWVTEPHQEISIVRDEKGFGSIPPITVIQSLAETVRKYGNENAMALKRPVNVILYTVSFPSCSYLTSFLGS